MLRVAASIHLAVALAFVTDVSAEVAFRGSPHVFTGSPSGGEEEAIPEELTIHSNRGLTLGEPVAISFENASREGLTYRLEPSVPGLSVDQSSSTVRGVPEEAAGAIVGFSLQAVNASGRVVASSRYIEWTLRDALRIAVVPGDLDMAIGASLPATRLLAQGAGGDRDTWSWELLGAPQWMELLGAEGGGVRIAIKAGMSSAAFSGNVFLSLSDGEGRKAAEQSFFVSVRADTCNANEGIACLDGTFLLSISSGGYEEHGIQTTIARHYIYLNGEDFPTTMTYSEAVAACAGLVEHGHDDWTLVNRNAASHVMTGGHAPKRMALMTHGADYWVGSYEARNSQRNYLRHAGTQTSGSYVYAPPSTKMRVRCMRKVPY